MKKNQTRLLICDWSGTLSDDRLPVYEANIVMMKNHKVPTVDYDTWLTQIASTLPEAMKNRGVNLNPELLFEEYAREYARIVQKGIARPTIYPDAKDFLAFARGNGMKLTIISSHPEEHVRYESDQYGVSKFFDLIKGSVHKKAPAIHDLMNTFAVQNNEAVVIGDTVWDIRAAKETLTGSIGVASGYSPRAKLEDEKPSLGVFNNLTEIIDSGILEYEPKKITLSFQS